MKKLLYITAVLFMTFDLAAQGNFYTPARSDTWVARDALGRSIEAGPSYPSVRPEKKVGIFYFIWQGAHGYDHHASTLPDEGVMAALPSDTVSPYDISKILKANPSDPQYGPVHAFHHWGEPYLGYYVADDRWVIRKHAQMLSDAGVDVIFLDVTNGSLYLPTVKVICDTYVKMREEGNKTPEIAFLLNSNPRETMNRLYNNFYRRGQYEELWFRWKGKPLVLCPPEAVTREIADFFTVRQSWFASDGEWFGDGKDKWTWGDLYPQKPGWHESPDKPEQVSVSSATHPIANIGRSYHDGRQPLPEDFKSGEGAFFAEQFGRALEIDPELVFITGWNEWVAMRFVDGAAKDMIGKPIKKGETYFVDQYNEEYSRDLEPMQGGFGDNYYYQMADFIRRYKGVNPLPEFPKVSPMDMDGRMGKWEAVKSVFYDDKGDVEGRNHQGWGRIRNYSDDSGRNDIVETKAACDGKNLYFYVRTAEPITPYTDNDWMKLFIEVRGDGGPHWEGFRYVVNNRVDGAGETALEESQGGWNWKHAATVSYKVSGNEMELAVPLKALGIKNKPLSKASPFTIDFKWIDNAASEGDILECIGKGDTAPNGRFRYRYVYSTR